MAAFHQIGNDSANMLFEQDLTGFRGAILSPVNYDPGGTAALAERARKDLKNFSLWLDPQLYVPNSRRGQLRTWPYFPSDFGTADLTQLAWWESINGEVVKASAQFSPQAICSPVPLPKNFANSYYTLSVSIANDLGKRLAGTDVVSVQTVIVSSRDLLADNRPMEIASIVSRTDAEWIYLLIYDETAPRREYGDSLEIEAILKFIAALKKADLRVMVGYSSSDMVLWKAAGADSVASGKFFNLRRFNRSRFEEPTEGGGQLPYWFEEGLMAFVREADLKRLERDGLLCATSMRNPLGKKILEQHRASPGTAWQALSWRQYLWWLVDCEARLNMDLDSTDQLLEAAEKNWVIVEQKKILFDERENGGAWVRPWRAALQGAKR